MNEYIAQSYFKEICNAYCIALKEKRRILKGNKMLQSLQRVTLTDEMFEKYLKSDFLSEEVSIELKALREAVKKYEDQNETSVEEYIFWRERENSLLNEISQLSNWLETNKASFIVTTEQEIITLICFIIKVRYPTIRIDGQHLEDFPKGKQWYKDFLEAYCAANTKEIYKIYNEI